MLLDRLGLFAFTLLSFSVGLSAVDLKAYDSTDCGSAMSDAPWYRCTDWPQHICCGFNNPEWWAPRTKSVGVDALPECGVANWFAASLIDGTNKCFTLKDTVIGAGSACMRNSGSIFEGGANW